MFLKSRRQFFQLTADHRPPTTELYHAFFYQRLQADSNKENFFCAKTTVFQ
jgi:hypothetical protein